MTKSILARHPLDTRHAAMQRASRLRCDDIPYFESQIRAWQGDDARSKGNVAEFTRRLRWAREELQRAEDAVALFDARKRTEALRG